MWSILTNRIKVYNGINEELAFTKDTNVVIMAYIDYNKDKRLFRNGTKLFEYDGKTVYPKILGTVSYPETVASFLASNRDLILKYDIIFIEIYKDPQKVSFDLLRSEGIL